MTRSEAVREAQRQGFRGLVRRNGSDITKRVLLAFDGQWHQRGNPECLERFSPSIDDDLSDDWEPSDAV